jgi:hypothetical protein
MIGRLESKKKASKGLAIVSIDTKVTKVIYVASYSIAHVVAC